MNLKKRILEIAYKNKLSHLGSYLSSLEIIEEIYKKKNSEDIFILSSGHAALALYVVLEAYEGRNAEMLFKKHGGHPHRNEEDGLYCSTGSLGLGITVAVGRALANPKRKQMPLLQDSGKLKDSIVENGTVGSYVEYTPVGVEIGSELEYARRQNEQRPFLFWSEELKQKVINYVAEQFAI